MNKLTLTAGLAPSRSYNAFIGTMDFVAWTCHKFGKCCLFICTLTQSVQHRRNCCSNLAMKSENCPMTVKKTFKNFMIALMTALDVECTACRIKRNPVSQVTSDLIAELDLEEVSKSSIEGTVKSIS